MKGDEESNSTRKALEKEILAQTSGDVLKLQDQVSELKTDLPFILKSIREATDNLEQTLAPQREFAQAELKKFIQGELKDIYISSRQAKDAALRGVEASINESARKGWLGTKNEAAETFKAAGDQFKITLERSVSSAVVIATNTFKGLCVDLENAQKENGRANMVVLLVGCVITGVISAILTVLILR